MIFSLKWAKNYGSIPSHIKTINPSPNHTRINLIAFIVSSSLSIFCHLLLELVHNN